MCTRLQGFSVLCFTPALSCQHAGASHRSATWVCWSAVRKTNWGAPVYHKNVVNSAALQTFPVRDTLSSGASLAQISKLFSANGQYYLTPELQGNVAVYNVSGATAFRTNTYYNTGGPYTFHMQTVLPPLPLAASTRLPGLCCPCRWAKMPSISCMHISVYWFLGFSRFQLGLCDKCSHALSLPACVSRQWRRNKPAQALCARIEHPILCTVQL